MILFGVHPFENKKQVEAAYFLPKCFQVLWEPKILAYVDKDLLEGVEEINFPKTINDLEKKVKKKYPFTVKLR